MDFTAISNSINSLAQNGVTLKHELAIPLSTYIGIAVLMFVIFFMAWAFRKI